ncbi:MAG: hypothetical protein FWD32_01125 [Firmicutes bacterium]|nr:hypothetical protein [Bacillota bacterium]
MVKKSAGIKKVQTQEGFEDWQYYSGNDNAKIEAILARVLKKYLVAFKELGAYDQV